MFRHLPPLGNLPRQPRIQGANLSTHARKKRARTHRLAPSFARKEILKTTAQLKIACFTQMIARLFKKFMRKSALKL